MLSVANGPNGLAYLWVYIGRCQLAESYVKSKKISGGKSGRKRMNDERLEAKEKIAIANIRKR
jgi:hypothetical protein